MFCSQLPNASPKAPILLSNACMQMSSFTRQHLHFSQLLALDNAYELLNLRALKISMLYKKNHIFQCMGKIFCVEFQRVPLKFHTIYLAHTLKNVDFYAQVEI